MNETESAAPEARTATLSLREVRFREPGPTVTASLDFRSTARRLGLVGEWGPLFRTLAGQSEISAGSARICGCPAEVAVLRGVVGLALCDPPLPDSFLVREYLEHAARLGHGSGTRAKAEAQHALEEFGLVELAARPLGALVLFQRRAVGIALAALSSPPVLCLEAPLWGLDAAAADYIVRLCAHAAEQSRLIVSAAVPTSPSSERALLGQCDELFLLQHGALAAHGSPESVFSAATRYVLTFVGANGVELANSLGASGCRLTQQASPTTFEALLDPSRRVSRYLVELPPAKSSDLLLDTALGLGVTVLELEPLLEPR